MGSRQRHAHEVWTPPGGRGCGPLKGGVPITGIAYVSTYPPRRCGIASFTHDLTTFASRGEIAVLDPPDHREPYPPEVRLRIRRDVRDDYRAAAATLNLRGLDAVSLQHEYGIWGGEDGSFVLDFVRALRRPVVTTLHTILRQPSAGQHRVLRELVRASTAAVVMSNAAAELLARVYDVGRTRVEVIPHGVPDLPFVDPDRAKPLLGLGGRHVVLSFGLLGPGKGYEAVIEAMPAVVAADPAACFVVVGATHPGLLACEGEAYRERLVARAGELGLDDHVRFVNRYVGRVELGRWLQAADVFITPYPNLEQIVSGTLSYALGAGTPAVSTPYAYALEALSGGRGILVPPGSPDAIATELARLLGDRALRESIRRRAYAYGRRMVWPAVGASYRRLFERVASGVPAQPAAALGRVANA